MKTDLSSFLEAVEEAKRLIALSYAVTIQPVTGLVNLVSAGIGSTVDDVRYTVRAEKTF